MRKKNAPPEGGAGGGVFHFLISFRTAWVRSVSSSA